MIMINNKLIYLALFILLVVLIYFNKTIIRPLFNTNYLVQIITGALLAVHIFEYFKYRQVQRTKTYSASQFISFNERKS